MAEATDASLIGDGESEHGTSTEYLDPWCDICFDKTGDRIRPGGFCPECNSFMCGSCTDYHKLWPTLKTHKILRGRKIPKSQADKPVKYPTCTTHAGNVKDNYCVSHSDMVCSQCMKQTHHRCFTKTLPDISKSIGAEHIQQFCNDIAALKGHITSAKEALENNASEIDKQKETIIKQAKDERDNIVSKAEKMFKDTVAMVSEACEQKQLSIADHVSSLEEIVHSLDEIANEINKKLSFEFDQNVFIQLQEKVASLRECETDIDDIKKELHKITLSFSISSEVSTFLLDSKYLGGLNELTSKFDNLTSLPEILFPQQKMQRDLSEIKCHKKASINTRTTQDKELCQTGGMYVTPNAMFVIDEANRSLKVFAENEKLLSCLAFSELPLDVTVIDNLTAAISTNLKDNKLYILNTSDLQNISIDRTVTLGYGIVGLTAYDGSLYAASKTKPGSVKMIDKSGREKWSISADSSGETLFVNNRSVVISCHEKTPKLIVTDLKQHTLTILDPRNGDLLDVIDVKNKSPHGLTADSDGNVYVYYYATKEICVFSPDFQHSRILLSQEELNGTPVEIVCSGTARVLYISYFKKDYIDCFQLS